MFSLPAVMGSLMLSYLFVAGGLRKLSDPDSFRAILRDYDILPPGACTAVARLIPLVELAAGVALLVPALSQAGLFVIACLLIIYSAAIAINIYRGNTELDCGCAGPGQEQTVSAWLLLRNAVLLAVAVFSALHIQSATLNLPGWCIAFLGAIFAILFYHVFDQLVANYKVLQRILHRG